METGLSLMEAEQCKNQGRILELRERNHKVFQESEWRFTRCFQKARTGRAYCAYSLISCHLLVLRVYFICLGNMERFLGGRIYKAFTKMAWGFMITKARDCQQHTSEQVQDRTLYSAICPQLHLILFSVGRGCANQTLHL